jgi:nucleoside 2-deoxyribosyltransferase
MEKKIKVYLAGQPNEYDNNWKESFKDIKGYDCYDWEFDSDQTSPDTFFPDDLNGVENADFMVANPGTAPSEATWIEVGYFLAKNTKKPGDTCKQLIIVWRDDRNPKWSVDFVKKAGHVVNSIAEAREKLCKLTKEKINS